MPYNELQRRDSWPPTIIHLRDAEEENLDNIDDDPISFFLTSPEDIDEFLDNEDLSAGIETPDSHTPVREVSPSDLQRVPLEDDDEVFGLAMPMTLKDFTAKHASGRKSRTGTRPEDALTGLGINMNIPEFSATRGRPKVRLTPARSGRGRGQTRSLSARRPQSWREPSSDIWTIREEREIDDDVTSEPGRTDVKVQTPVSMSAPASTNIGAMMSPKPKPKKRVHWAC
jgi:hypothetical protein